MTLHRIPKHKLVGKCLECQAPVTADALRESSFRCKLGHESNIANVVCDMTVLLANRARALQGLPALPVKLGLSGFARPKGELAKLLRNRARVLVEKLGKVEAKRHAGKMLESAETSGNTAQIEAQQGLIAEIEAI